ncbi:hypothetical protein LZC95_19465 [Pendulispora brunnea]|uniref:Uncharacterized protein n=1 Tax=Pendulispora brunnea TaxID=2905690 RepID=A0ABZ2KJY5_9BACT
MAVYTTFFVATVEELYAALPNWVKPLEHPVKRTRTNPFTGESVTYDSWEPEDVFAAASGEPPAEPRAPSIVTGAGDYEAFLHARLPKGVRSLPHFAGKSILPPHTQQLLAAIASREEEALAPALFPSPSTRSGAMLDRLPAWGIEALAAVRDEELRALGEVLAEREG